LVYQGRKKRWQDTKIGRFLPFPAVVDRLKAMAKEIATAAVDAPQPKIEVLDVSTAASRSKAKRRRTAVTDARPPRAGRAA
jgi:hypothetical protein